MRIILIWLCYLAILCGALSWSQSTSGWLILGLAPVLWLDCYVFRELPWPGTANLGRGVLLRIGFFLPVALLFGYLGRAVITVREAIYLGVVASLFFFLVERTLDLLLRLADRLGKSTVLPSRLRLRNVFVMFVVCLGLVFLIPLKAFHPLSIVPGRTPAQEGLAYEDVTIATADGLELAAWLVPCAEPKGSIIFCHGHGGNRQESCLYLAKLHELGLQVLAFDFRGSGESPGHTATFGYREVRDVMAAEAYLAQRFPDRPIFIFGISYGAAVTLQALPQLPHVRGAWVESSFSRMRDLADNQFDNLEVGTRDRLIYAYSVVTWLDCGCWMPDVNPIDHVGRIDVPIMFCHGRKDWLIPFFQGEALYAACRSPRKACYWVDNGTHGLLPLEAGPEYFRRFQSFFAACLRESQPDLLRRERQRVAAPAR